MHHLNLITRRGFLDRSMKLGLGVALSTLVDVPLVLKRALAEGNIGVPGPNGATKKLLFIFLRGANDGLNALIPVRDDAYNSTNRPDLYIPEDGAAGIYDATTGVADFPASSSNSAATDFNTFWYGNSIALRNGFAALHPSLKFLAPVHNAGDLVLAHRVGYPKQSRSHFDSQRYWENGTPNNNVLQEGIFYRALVESGLARTAPLTGVSIQSALPLLLRGSAAAMTNLNDPTRYELLGVPNTAAGKFKALGGIQTATPYPFPAKLSRELLNLQYENLSQTLQIFDGITGFDETGNLFEDDTPTDGDVGPYYLFPTAAAKNGGGRYHTALNGQGQPAPDPNKFVVDDTNPAYAFFRNLKAAALVLNNTDAIIAGTEVTGWDTHNNQGGVTGTHASLLRRVGWAMYALRKYFSVYGRGNNAPSADRKVNWDDVVVVTLSEFGRTTIQNANNGTDHAEAGTMFVAGGAVRGGVYGCHPNDQYNGHALPWITGQIGSMFGVNDRYLKRVIDYRSVLGELIRDHLGATPSQLGRIIPGYADAGEHLLGGGTSSLDGTPIAGELGIV
ncbi:MAG: DUF1501 domain-containing protein [Verrucomicrobia bacterium]|nr:DUF1501 domain-containing protein [Verrucomicrobiota bacterium]